VRVVLEKGGHGSAEVGESEGLDIAVIDEDRALCWVEDTRDEFQYRTLSRAIPPDNDLQHVQREYCKSGGTYAKLTS
jgi:hypothetical protein